MTEYTFTMKLLDFVGTVIVVRHKYGYIAGRLDFSPERQQYEVVIEASGSRKARVVFTEKVIRGTPTFSEGALRIELL